MSLLQLEILTCLIDHNDLVAIFTGRNCHCTNLFTLGATIFCGGHVKIHYNRALRQISGRLLVFFALPTSVSVCNYVNWTISRCSHRVVVIGGHVKSCMDISILSWSYCPVTLLVLGKLFSTNVELSFLKSKSTFCCEGCSCHRITISEFKIASKNSFCQVTISCSSPNFILMCDGTVRIDWANGPSPSLCCKLRLLHLKIQKACSFILVICKSCVTFVGSVAAFRVSILSIANSKFSITHILQTVCTSHLVKSPGIFTCIFTSCGVSRGSASWPN